MASSPTSLSPTAVNEPAVQRTRRNRPRLRKACQRCRLRKQRCDGQEPACRNCASARVECIPAAQEPTDVYPVGYVKSLEQHVATLESALRTQVPGSASDHLVQESTAESELNGQPLMWHLSLDTSPLSLEGGQNEEHLFSIIQEEPANAPNPGDGIDPICSSYPAIEPEISVSDGASFFQSYFELIHPRYPFLDVEECSKAYLQWKTQTSPGNNLSWFTFLVKMVFAIGSVLQKAKLDHTTRLQHSELMAQAQSEQSIMTSDAYPPLVRLQAMLLYAIYAIHDESTSRIVHITGVLMRFSVLHGFHQLQDDGSANMSLKIKAWSCAYAIDKMIGITLRIPTYPADEWIRSPLYEIRDEGQFFMPWALDARGPYAGRLYIFDLCYFAHMYDLGEYVKKTREEIDQWAHSDKVSAHSQLNADGYSSTLGLVHTGNLTRVVLYSAPTVDVSSPVADELLQACCDTSVSSRLLQKKRQIPKPWFDMIFQFQVGVTILYILWRRAAAPSKSVDRAIRYCTSTLAIFADRAANAESYRECLDILASSVLRAEPLGVIDKESVDELIVLVKRVEQNGAAPYIVQMLREMAQG